MKKTSENQSTQKFNTIISSLIYFVLISSFCFAQVDTLRITTYNILQFPDAEYLQRIPYFRTVINIIDPDVLVVQEMKTEQGVSYFLNDVLNYYEPGKYTAGPFVDGPDTDNAIFYRADKLSLVSNRQIATDLRDISEYVLIYTGVINPQEIRVYSLDFKGVNDSYSEQRRFAESIVLRNELNTLSANSYFIAAGNYNFYTSAEDGFVVLTEISDDNDGRCFDPTQRTGDWYNDSTYADLHTQSTRIVEFGGGSGIGMVERSDMILLSAAFLDGIDYEYMSGSYTVFGNDSLHFRTYINKSPNQSVPDSVADALYYASDHLPVYVDITISGTAVPVELINFQAHAEDHGVRLSWATASESNNYGFDIERKSGAAAWKKIGFVPGQGTISQRYEYSFYDKNLDNGNYSYRLKQIDFDGGIQYSPTVQIFINAPKQFWLGQNFPNPFNSKTKINFYLPKKAHVNLTIYDLAGKEIVNILDEDYLAGRHEFSFDASLLTSGLFFYKLEADDFVSVKKFMILK